MTKTITVPFGEWTEDGTYLVKTSRVKSCYRLRRDNNLGKFTRHLVQRIWREEELPSPWEPLATFQADLEHEKRFSDVVAETAFIERFGEVFCE